MAKGRITVKVTEKGASKTTWAEFFGRGKATVEVGIFGEKGDAQHEDSDLTVGEIATIHEFGLGNVPERSWLRAWFDENNTKLREGLLKMMKKAIQESIRSGKPISDTTRKQVMDKLGLFAVGGIQSRIAAGEIQPPLDPKTVARKGSSIPLMDTGQLRSSISHQTKVGK